MMCYVKYILAQKSHFLQKTSLSTSLLSRQRKERGTTSYTRAEIVTGICSYPAGPQPQAVRGRGVAFVWCSPEQGWYSQNIQSLLDNPTANSLARKSRFFSPLCSRCFCAGLFRAHVRVYEEKTETTNRKLAPY